MAKVDGIIILDSTGRSIITSHFRAHPPSYPFLHIDALNDVLRNRDEQLNPLEPVIWVNSLSKDGGQAGSALCHTQREGVRFLVPISEEVNPVFAFAFLDSFLDTLADYLGGEITEGALRDNFDIVYMLIEEMLDEGHPMTMEPNMLKEIVLPPSMIRKLLNAAGVSGLQQTNTAPFTAPIPWRSPGVRHANNEIFFDIEESLDALVDRRGNVLASDVWGTIHCNARLSGSPDLQVSFSNPSAITSCSFHPCIRFKKWDENRLISFIPPDGHFKLLEYQAAKPTSGKLLIPLSLKPAMTLGDHGGKFALTLSSRVSHTSVEKIIVSIYLGDTATSVSATASTTGDRRTGSSWEFDPNTKVLRWMVDSISANERPPSLVGTFVSSDETPIPNPSFSVAFRIQNHSLSGLKVDQVKVLGDTMYKPFKGIKGGVQGSRLEVRW